MINIKAGSEKTRFVQQTMSSTLSFLVSSQIDVSENLLTSLIGRDELTITESPNDEDIIGSFTLDIQKSRIRDQDCFYVHQVQWSSNV